MSLERTHLASHTPDGTDALGDGLEVEIRIGSDGRVYFHDIPPRLAPVVLALNPTDEALVRRLGTLPMVTQPATTPTATNSLRDSSTMP